MLDPRIYRTGLIAVALAVVVLAFSLQNQPGAAHATLTPDAFNGAVRAQSDESVGEPLSRPAAGLGRRTRISPARSPTASASRASRVATDVYTARTATGTDTLENVTATRAGTSSGTIVVVAPRDHLGPRAAASLSGTATLVDLASVMSGETLNHTIVLASTSGSDGGAGAARLLQTVPGPIDAVIVLGDMVGTHARQPVVVPWSNGVGSHRSSCATPSRRRSSRRPD